mmetsp:Transcript_5150/g.8671  ORF Transcript_5150/g.8671 Transcript_5150/m.8671 type:complete len:108 (+) Transcript_5150:427-750(+)
MPLPTLSPPPPRSEEVASVGTPAHPSLLAVARLSGRPWWRWRWWRRPSGVVGVVARALTARREVQVDEKPGLLAEVDGGGGGDDDDDNDDEEGWRGRRLAAAAVRAP